jgi:hypothetical protein
MKNYCALLNNDVVAEIIVADFDWVQNNLQGDWHDLGADPLTVAIGWTYDADLNEFVPPPEPIEPDDEPIDEP